MATAKLTIAGQGGSTEVALDANGAIIGRSPSCDAVLDSGRVSRRHARIFQDPFGRWIVEDLGSRNGVTIGGQRIGARAVLPGEKIVVGPFTLSLSQEVDQDIAPDPSVPTGTTLIEEDATDKENH